MLKLWARVGGVTKNREHFAVLCGILGTSMLIFLACLWKYATFGYNGIDLAYFSQVFWNTVHGRLFTQSIHPHLSLGDHAEFAILPLSLLYAPFRDARALLALQAIALAACAWPAWRIARFRLAANHAALPFAGVLFAALVLLNPSLQNIGLFEFHILAFAAFPLLMAMLAYETGDKKRFIIWCVAALLVREDVAMVVAMIGVLAYFEKKSMWWRVVPFTMGAVWFLAAMRLIAHFSPDGGYKFKIYYAWLGATPLAMLAFPFSHPLQFLGHLFTLANLEMLLGFLMPLALLPLLRPRRLLLAAGPLLQIILGAPGGGELVLQTHYATLFLPAVFLAAIDGAAELPAFVRRVTRFPAADASVLATALVSICGLYGMFVMGPLPRVAYAAATDRLASVRAARYTELLSKIPADASVASTYALLPALSNREHLTSLHYVGLGVLQFAEGPYTPPANLRMVALDADDLVTYRAQFLETTWAKPQYDGLLGRIESVMGAPIFADGTVALYDMESAQLPVSWDTGFTVPNTEPSASASVRHDATSGNDVLRTTISLGTSTPPEGATVRYTLADARGRVLTDDRVPVESPAPWTARNGGIVLHLTTTVPPGAAWPVTPHATIVVSNSTLMLDGTLSAVRHERSMSEWRSFAMPTIEAPR